MKRKAGFTMIEAVVIIAVLAILAGILTPMVIREVAKAKTTRVIADMEAIATAFTQYFIDTGYWPERYTGLSDEKADLIGFRCLYADPGDLIGWDGPYLERGVRVGESFQVARVEGAAKSRDASSVVAQPPSSSGRYSGLVDAWGMPFRLFYGRIGSSNAGAGGAIVLVSAGPNRVFDTSDHIAMRGETAEDDIVKVITRRIR